jgi:hypothetical protein
VDSPLFTELAGIVRNAFMSVVQVLAEHASQMTAEEFA